MIYYYRLLLLDINPPSNFLIVHVVLFLLVLFFKLLNAPNQIAHFFFLCEIQVYPKLSISHYKLFVLQQNGNGYVFTGFFRYRNTIKLQSLEKSFQINHFYLLFQILGFACNDCSLNFYITLNMYSYHFPF